MMLMNIPTVAKIYAMNSAQPAVSTQRIRLIVKIGSLLDQTIRRWMLYHTLLTVGAISECKRTGTDHLQGAAPKRDVPECLMHFLAYLPSCRRFLFHVGLPLTRCRKPQEAGHQTLILDLLLCFNVLGTNRGPTDRIQHINKHSMICQVDTIDFSEKHSLKKPPYAFGSELVKKSETVKAC